MTSKLFTVHNYRRGFACNSSSSHSVVFFEGALPHDDYESGNFNWSNFTLSSREAKEAYFAAQLNSQLNQFLPPVPLQERNWQERREQERQLYRRAEAEGLIAAGHPDEGSVDHQSILSLATDFKREWFLRPFLAKMRARLLQDDVVVLGGNDNGGEHPLRAEQQEVFAEMSYGLRGRDDGTHFAIFDHEGTKQRVTFEDEAPSPKRGRTPELVDVKVTDWCDKGCRYCYQNSTTKGLHAPWEQLENLVRQLAKMEVFEIAFGGGEPTAHPRFMDLLKLTRSLHIVPNFTTRNIDYLVKHGEELAQVVGAVAFSVDSAADVQMVRQRLGVKTVMNGKQEEVAYPTIHNPIWNSLQFQVVHGAVSTRELLAIEKAKLLRPLLLLGWKQNGRGSQVEPVECDWTKLELRYGLRVDTAMVQQFRPQLEALKADPRTFSGEEGTFSCYIDAVRGQIGPSSYCSLHLMELCEPFASQDFLQHAWNEMDIQR